MRRFRLFEKKFTANCCMEQLAIFKKAGSMYHKLDELLDHLTKYYSLYKHLKTDPYPFALSLSKDRRVTFRSWFDSLTTNGLAIQ